MLSSTFAGKGKERSTATRSARVTALRLRIPPFARRHSERRRGGVSTALGKMGKAFREMTLRLDCHTKTGLDPAGTPMKAAFSA